MTNKTVYLNGLNGLRAIAAISVVIGHITSLTFTTFDFNLPRITIGFDGVTLFFVISGFLISYLLLLEKVETNDINIINFYIRRVLRIWPIYYLFILISVIVAFFDTTIKDIFSNTIFYYLFFAANLPTILHNSVTIIVHYWSIGVEEQFYLFWPWIVKLVRTKLLPVTIAIVIGLFLLKSASWFFLGNHSILYKSLVVTRFHCMLIGAIGAMLYKNYNQRFISAITNKWTQGVVWLFSVLLFLDIIYLPAPLTYEITAIVSLALILGQIDNAAFKLVNLENRILDFLGKISYGIYVIHPLVILLFSHLYRNLNLSFIPQLIIVYSTIILITILLAFISYEYFEKKFLRLKKKYTIVESSNSRFK
ncbi:MAG: acyltransferase [Paludibacter sp.]|nr:acyltransferase [Paludibacter sp.]